MKVSKALASMSDEDFERQLQTAQKNAPSASGNEQQKAPPSFVPRHLCVSPQPVCPPQPKKPAREAALEWWGNAAEDGTTGMERISELISRIAFDDPSKHTCVLNDYEEVRLPRDSEVLIALVGIMKENGLEADFNDDELLTIFWAQYEDGLEAAAAHAQA